MDVPSGIALVAAALKGIETAKNLISGIRKTTDDAGHKQALSEVYDAILETKEQIHEMSNTIRERDHEIADLKEKLRIKGKKVWEQPCLWLEEGGKRDGPYCQVCDDRDGKLIHLHDYGDGSFGCPVCKKTYFPRNWHASDSGEGERFWTDRSR